MAAFCTTPLLAIALYVLAARCVAADVTAGTPADAATSPVASQFHSTLSWAPCGDVATQGHCCAETRVSVTSTDALQISVQTNDDALVLESFFISVSLLESGASVAEWASRLAAPPAMRVNTQSHHTYVVTALLTGGPSASTAVTSDVDVVDGDASGGCDGSALLVVAASQSAVRVVDAPRDAMSAARRLHTSPGPSTAGTVQGQAVTSASRTPLPQRSSAESSGDASGSSSSSSTPPSPSLSPSPLQPSNEGGTVLPSVNVRGSSSGLNGSQLAAVISGCVIAGSVVVSIIMYAACRPRAADSLSVASGGSKRSSSSSRTRDSGRSRGSTSTSRRSQRSSSATPRLRVDEDGTVAVVVRGRKIIRKRDADDMRDVAERSRAQLDSVRRRRDAERDAAAARRREKQRRGRDERRRREAAEAAARPRSKSTTREGVERQGGGKEDLPQPDDAAAQRGRGADTGQSKATAGGDGREPSRKSTSPRATRQQPTSPRASSKERVAADAGAAKPRGGSVERVRTSDSGREKEREKERGREKASRTRSADRAAPSSTPKHSTPRSGVRGSSTDSRRQGGDDKRAKSAKGGEEAKAKTLLQHVDERRRLSGGDSRGGAVVPGRRRQGADVATAGGRADPRVQPRVQTRIAEEEKLASSSPDTGVSSGVAAPKSPPRSPPRASAQAAALAAGSESKLAERSPSTMPRPMQPGAAALAGRAAGPDSRGRQMVTRPMSTLPPSLAVPPPRSAAAGAPLAAGAASGGISAGGGAGRPRPQASSSAPQTGHPVPRPTAAARTASSTGTPGTAASTPSASTSLPSSSSSTSNSESSSSSSSSSQQHRSKPAAVAAAAVVSPRVGALSAIPEDADDDGTEAQTATLAPAGSGGEDSDASPKARDVPVVIPKSRNVNLAPVLPRQGYRVFL